MVGGKLFPVAIADFNADGRRDVAVGSENSDIVNVLYGKPGGFKPTRQFPAGSYPFGIATADFNDDGRTDLAVANYDADSVSVLTSKPGGFRTPRSFPIGSPASEPYFIAAGDLNGDGRADIVSANDGSDSVGVLLGKAGGFRPVQERSTGAGTAPVSVSLGDFNGDRRLDVAALNYAGVGGTTGSEVALLRGRGDGTLRSPIYSDAGTDATYGFVKGRFNNDHKLDLVVSDCTNANKTLLLRGRGNGTFRAPVAYPSVPDSCTYEPAAADYNGDGRLDVANVSESDGRVGISFQKPSGGFGMPRLLSAVSEAYSVAAGDLNGDGAPDLAVPDYGNPDTAILLNRP
jgi:hypothetical protein